MRRSNQNPSTESAIRYSAPLTAKVTGRPKVRLLDTNERETGALNVEQLGVVV